MSLSPLPPSSTLLLLLAPVFPPIHPPAFYSSKGVEEFAAKINEFIFTHHPSSSAEWGRAAQLMTVEEGGRGGLQAQPEDCMACPPRQQWRICGQCGATAAGMSSGCGASSGVWSLRAALCCGRWVGGLEECPLWSSKAENHHQI